MTVAETSIDRLSANRSFSGPPVVHSLIVEVIDGCRLVIDGAPVDLRGRKARCVAALLAMQPGKPLSRERLVGFFWSESDEERARASLRQTVKELRDGTLPLGYDGFIAERSDLMAAPGTIRLDLEDILVELAEDKVPNILLERQRLVDQVLVGFDDIDPAFRVWLAAYRQGLSDQITRSLERAMNNALSRSDAAKAADCAQALLNLDPTHEAACRCLMRSKAIHGDAAGALRVYKALWDLLDSEFDTEPGAETQALVVSIKQGVLEHQANDFSTRYVKSPRDDIGNARPFIAVLGFRTIELSQLQSDRTACFRHELLSCLVRFREWQIIEFEDLERLKPSVRSNVDEAANGRFVVEATAYGSADVTTLVLTLRDFENARYVWSERFELSPNTWFDIQRDIVRRIGASLRINISAERAAKLSKKPTLSFALHDRWVKGQALFNGYRADEFSEAESIFREIVAEDDSFSPAFSSLAQLCNSRHLASPGKWRTAETEAESLSFAQQAAQTDPIDSRAQLCLAWSNAMAGNYEASAPCFASAITLNDSDPWTITSAAHGYAFLGDMDEARRLDHKLMSLVQSPSRTQWAYLVGTRFLHGDYEGAVAAADAAKDAITNIAAWKAAALHWLARTSEATAELQHFFQLVRNHWKGDQPADDHVMIRWFLHNFPVRRRSDWERLRDGVYGAGAPFVPYEERRPPHLAIG